MRVRTEKALFTALDGLVVWMIALIPFIWPIMFLPKAHGWPFAWFVQVCWGLLLALLAVVWFRRMRAKTQARVTAQLAYEEQLAQHRAYMARNNQPWLDNAAGHYRHGTCTIKHRSDGAAATRSSTI